MGKPLYSRMPSIIRGYGWVTEWKLSKPEVACAYENLRAYQKERKKLVNKVAFPFVLRKLNPCTLKKLKARTQIFVHHVHSSIIPTSQRLETTQMSINRWMPKWNVTPTSYMEYYLAFQRNEILFFSHLWGFWDLSSLTRDRTHVSCTDRWILYHWATREALNCLFLNG